MLPSEVAAILSRRFGLRRALRYSMRKQSAGSNVVFFSIVEAILRGNV